jgi:hypothetical protein
MAAMPIEGKELTSWNVLPGGLRIALHLVGIDEEAHCVVLSVDALSGLMMTLPGMLQTALDARFPTGSFRIVHRISGWQLEQEASRGDLILKLQTRDGFEVAFDLGHERACQLAADLQAASAGPRPDPVRKPN